MCTCQVVDLYSVHHNPARPWLFAVGGTDPHARVYDIRRISSSAPSARMARSYDTVRPVVVVACT